MINPNDLAILKQIEAQIDQPFPQLDPAEDNMYNVGYTLDDMQMVVAGLYLYEIKISDLSPFVNLHNLTTLFVSSDQLSDFLPLINLTNLNELGVGGYQISDLSPLTKLHNLTTLYVGGDQINDLSPLTKLHNLTTLYVGSNQISDLSPLTKLHNLTTLYIEGDQINDLSPLAILTNLTTLHIGGNQISDLSPLTPLTNLTTLYVDYSRISDLIPLANLADLTELSIRGNQLNDLSPLANLHKLTTLVVIARKISDFTPLANLVNLTELSIRGNQLNDLSPLANLHKLTTLYVSGDQLSDLSPLANLSSLTTLHIGHVQVTDAGFLIDATKISDLTALTNLNKLTTLYVSGDQLSDLSPLTNLINLISLDLINAQQLSDLFPLAKLINLTTLSIHGNQLSDLSPLAKLTNLTTLSIDGNQLSDLLPLANLTSLTTLSIHGNQLSDLSPLANLTSLTTLSIHRSQISDLSPLAKLQNLTYFGASNTLINDLSPLANLANLTTLSVHNTQLSNLSPIINFPNLTKLDARSCPLAQLDPAVVANFEQVIWEADYFDGNGLHLYDNPLVEPPVEIVQQGKEAIMTYFEAGPRAPLNEVKLLLVGDGMVGKTSLMKGLRGLDFNPKESQTHGINLATWQPPEQEKAVQVRLWDFGGQEIMHATHQFFLSKRSVYVLVLDARREQKAEHWLKLIHSFGDQSPVLVVLNKIDETPSFDLDRRFLREKYPTIHDFYRVSCKTGQGLDALSQGISQAFAHVPLIQTVWPQRWFALKQRLETLAEEKQFIQESTYRQLCQAEQISDPTTQDVLVEYLHDLGVIVHFADFDLRDVHVLEPRWVTEGVYKLLNAPYLAERRGVLAKAAISKILITSPADQQRYPKDKHRYLIELMKKFELCYQLDSETVLIPDLLAVPAPAYTLPEGDTLHFVIDYDFLPRSILPRFIVRMHTDIKDDLRWRTGVVLANARFGAEARVRADNEARRIEIAVVGQNRRDYFAALLFCFREINDRFEGLTYIEKVPMPDNSSVTVSYAQLLKMAERGRRTYWPDGADDEYDIQELLRLYNIPGKTLPAEGQTYIENQTIYQQQGQTILGSQGNIGRDVRG